MNPVITVRVSKDLKEKIGKYGIVVSEVARRALEEEIEKKRLDEAGRAAESLGKLFAKMSEEEIVKDIKEARRLR